MILEPPTRDRYHCATGLVVAQLRNLDKGQVIVLESELLVGRSSECGLRLPASYVSGQHAIIRWNGQGWEMRDLASTNGTFVEKTRVKPGSVVVMRMGQVLGFGDLTERWEVADLAPPRVAAIPIDGGEPLVIDREMLAIPSGQRPVVTIFRGRDGRWLIERADTPDSALANGDVFVVAGVTYRFSCPEAVAPTWTSGNPSEMESLTLQFGVTRDEEYVEIQVGLPDGTVNLRARNHNYLLLLLARQRLQDAAAGHPDGECGWTYQDVLEEQLRVTQSQLNIDVFRIRRAFGAMPISNAASIIERRSRVRQLRIGTAKLGINVI